MHGVVHALAVAHLVEDEELRLRTEIGGLANAGGLQVGLGLLGDVAGVAAIGLAGDRVPDVTDQDERGRKSIIWTLLSLIALRTSSGVAQLSAMSFLPRSGSLMTWKADGPHR